MKKNIAIIGGGISGISLARMLHGKANVTVFEQKEKIGGLIGCERVEGILYHRVGGHVFNSRNAEVLDWFWNFFDKDTEFIKARRFAKVFMEGRFVDYPIENHIFQLGSPVAESIIGDLLGLAGGPVPDNFEDFLLRSFGETLYGLYFRPYNKKIWNTDLKQVPLGWLEGKLPMPNLREVITSNILRKEEGEMVHSSFFYPKRGGSQFIIERLAEGLTLEEGFKVEAITKTGEQLYVNEAGPFDEVVYTGDVRELPRYATAFGLEDYADELAALKSNGTTNILCRCDPSELSWLYIPEDTFRAHRIIYTGNFSDTNNGDSGRSSCTVEFSNYVDIEEVKGELQRLPGNLEMVSWNYEPNSYVIQEGPTRSLIQEVKETLAPHHIHLLGRFAEWEYYNMDKCIEASMKLIKCELAN